MENESCLANGFLQVADEEEELSAAAKTPTLVVINTIKGNSICGTVF